MLACAMPWTGNASNISHIRRVRTIFVITGNIPLWLRQGKLGKVATLARIYPKTFNRFNCSTNNMRTTLSCNFCGWVNFILSR